MTNPSHERRTYSLDGEASYFQDIGALTLTNDAQARSRLEAHEQEVNREVELQTREGQRVAAERRSRAEMSPELRAATTSTMSGWTTPQYLLDEMALYRGINRSFVDQTHIMPIPKTGMAFHVPQMTGASGEAIVTENSTVTETDATGDDLATNVTTVAGQMYVSIQLHDRGMQGGGTFDAVVAAQLQQQLDQATDLYALNQAITAGGAVTETGSSFSIADFYEDLALAREELTDAAGTRYRPTHIFTTSNLEGYVSRQLDSENRPLVTPVTKPGVPLRDNTPYPERWEGFTGIILPGNLLWFFDDNIPASGSNTQIIVSRPETVLTLEGTPAFAVYPDNKANDLQVLLQLRNYVCVIPRFPDANAVLTGAAYPTSLK